MQNLLGADIQMQFDECTPFPATYAEAERSMQLSLRWAERSLAAFRDYAQPGRALFGIVQGSIYPELRAQSSAALTSMDFNGYSIGGLAVGEGQKAMFETLSCTATFLPETKPRYLMGVGTPSDIVGAVERGVDMFDCVMPTRSGRHGQAFTWGGSFNMRNAAYRGHEPTRRSKQLPCGPRLLQGLYPPPAARRRILAPMILSWANVHFYQDLMAAIRQSIRDGSFAELAARIRNAYPSTAAASDETRRLCRRPGSG